MKFLLMGLILLHSITSFGKWAHTISYSEQPKFQLIEFSGSISFSLYYKDLLRVIKKIHGKKDIVLKVGNSSGGFQPTFRRLMKSIKAQCYFKRGSKCRLTAVFTSRCASSCTDLPLLADYAVALPGARFGFHRLWFFKPSFAIQTTKMAAKSYIRLGGFREWFLPNREKVFKDQLNVYYMTDEEEIASGLIDKHFSTFEEFTASL